MISLDQFRIVIENSQHGQEESTMHIIEKLIWKREELNALNNTSRHYMKQDYLLNGNRNWIQMASFYVL